MTDSASKTQRAWIAAVSLFSVFSAVYLEVAYSGQPVTTLCGSGLGQSAALEQQVQQVVQELLGQSSALPEQESETVFYLGETLTETMRQLSPATPRPLQTPAVTEATLRELHTKHLLSAADLPYMRQQMARSADFRLWPEWVTGHHLMPTDTVAMLYSKYGADWFSLPTLQKRYPITHLFSLSKPLLSCDGQTAIVELDYRCGGKCGLERTWVLQRRDGQWHKARELGYVIY